MGFLFLKDLADLSVKFWERVAMEGEGHLERQVRPVDLGERLSIQQEQVGHLLLPITDQGDQHTVVFRPSTRPWDEEHLARIVAVLRPGLVVHRVLEVFLHQALTQP